MKGGTKILFLIVFIITFIVPPVWIYIANIGDRMEFKEKIRTGECVAIDQFGRCYSGEEYQNYLESIRNQKIEIPDWVVDDKANKELLKHFNPF